MILTSRCSIWLVPSPDTARPLERAIDRLAARLGTPAFAPHVTVRGGLDAAADEVIAALGAMMGDLAPTAATVRGVGHGEDRFHCLFLELDAFDGLTRLRARLRQRYGAPSVPEPWPHLSLVYGHLPLATRQALAAEVAVLRDGEVVLDRVAVVDHGSDLEAVASWRVGPALALASAMPATGREPDRPRTSDDRLEGARS